MPAHSFDEDDRDAPQEMDLEWAEGQDDDDEVPCPNCGEMIHEDSPRCPHCGNWVVAGSSERQGRSWGWMIVAALLIAVVLVVWNRL